MAEATEKHAVLILADISGYTRFMVENQTAAVHGQTVITFLIETLLQEVDIPLVLQGIEGDAVFLSASHPGTEDGWLDVLTQVRTKLDRFFGVFLEGVVRMAESTVCGCPSCAHIEQLKLKIIVHIGRVVYHEIAGLAQVSGTDVILIHRLLKNSVQGREYLLMTDAAYRDIGCGMEGTFVTGEEQCEGIGRVRTWVRLMEASREQARDAFFDRPETAMDEQADVEFSWAGPALVRALLEQLRRPSTEASLPRRAGFSVAFLARMLVQAASLRRAMRLRLRERWARYRARTDAPTTS